MNTLFKYLFGISFFMLLIILFTSIVYLYEKKSKIISFLNKNLNVTSEDYSSNNKDNVYWAKEIMNGGYILHFRHAERDKWIDVQMYDALESDVHNNGLDDSRYAENDYFAQAVCLNDRGKVQAKAMGESLKHIGLPIGRVISSVSCRARQTAELAFGGYDELKRILVHKGPYFEDEQERIKKLINLYQNVKIEEGKNVIISAHNSVIDCKMFINYKCPQHKLDLEEGGFYVLSKTKEGLKFEYEFHNFRFFNEVFYER